MRRKFQIVVTLDVDIIEMLERKEWEDIEVYLVSTLESNIIYDTGADIEPIEIEEIS